MIVNILLFRITLILYSVSAVLYLVDVIRRKTKAGKTGRAARWILVGGFALHCATLVARYIEAGYTPIVNLHESLSFFSWTLIGIFLLFDLRYRMTVLGAFSCPLAVILVFISYTRNNFV